MGGSEGVNGPAVDGRGKLTKAQKQAQLKARLDECLVSRSEDYRAAILQHLSEIDVDLANELFDFHLAAAKLELALEQVTSLDTRIVAGAVAAESLVENLVRDFQQLQSQINSLGADIENLKQELAAFLELTQTLLASLKKNTEVSESHPQRMAQNLVKGLTPYKEAVDGLHKLLGEIQTGGGISVTHRTPYPWHENLRSAAGLLVLLLGGLYFLAPVVTRQVMTEISECAQNYSDGNGKGIIRCPQGFEIPAAWRKPTPLKRN